ncbi:hypothetical protein GS966_29855 [Rhodococcus hoagii]|nr:hypothetical protein [Prescottella equi]
MTMVTHYSLAELEKAGGLGLVERSRARIIGPVPEAEVDRLSKFMKFSEAERNIAQHGWAPTAHRPVDEKKALRQAAARPRVNYVRRRRHGGHLGARDQAHPRPASDSSCSSSGEGAAPGTPSRCGFPQRKKLPASTTPTPDCARPTTTEEGIASMTTSVAD